MHDEKLFHNVIYCLKPEKKINKLHAINSFIAKQYSKLLKY